MRCPNCKSDKVIKTDNEIKCESCGYIAIKTENDASLNEAINKTKLIRG